MHCCGDKADKEYASKVAEGDRDKLLFARFKLPLELASAAAAEGTELLATAHDGTTVSLKDVLRRFFEVNLWDQPLIHSLFVCVVKCRCPKAFTC